MTAVGQLGGYRLCFDHAAAARPAHADRRAEQAAEYERLLAERELPRWRECKERGAFISARIFRAAFGTDPR